MEMEGLIKLASRLKRLRVVIANTPANPTGYVMTPEEKRGLLATATPGVMVWNGTAHVPYDDDVKADLEAEIAEIERLLS